MIFRLNTNTPFISAIFTVITFPFLFGIMFGDMAHGLFLFLFGAWFIYKESYFDLRKHLLDEVND